MKELGRRQRGERALLAALKSELADLEHLLESVSTEWGYEDSVYRFYHQSFKVYRVQQSTLQLSR
jgi:hypothetical protein